MSNINILVATHKRYQMPKEKVYLPIHVGRQLNEELGYQGDDTGENISLKNPNFCELTGLYWAWKNIDCDIIGLSHYRRYFTIKSSLERFKYKDDRFKLILSGKEIEDLLSQHDVILPQKRNYYIETIWSHYQHAHNIKDLEKTKEIIEKKFPEYLDSFNNVMNGRSLHLYNMFIMKKEDFDQYCEWLFDILFELEKRTDISEYDAYQSRIFGFISERLFNVWLDQAQLKQKEISVISIEKIKWVNKISEFLMRKVKR
jgi:hypothetical protein